MQCHVGPYVVRNSQIRTWHMMWFHVRHFWLLGGTIYGLCQHQKRAYVISQHPFESMLYAIFLTVHMIHSYLSYCDISTRLRNSAYLPSTSSCPHTKVYNVYYTTTIGQVTGSGSVITSLAHVTVIGYGPVWSVPCTADHAGVVSDCLKSSHGNKPSLVLDAYMHRLTW